LQGNAQFPAPLIYAAMGDVVEIRLKNLGTTVATAPNDPHSIHLHGLDVEAANDGVPETSVGAIPANLCDNGLTDLVAPINCIGLEDPTADPPIPPSTGFAPGAGNVVVYMFSPKFPGTYMYHCHQEASIHVQMGMYGALVVYNRGDPAAATGPGTGKGGTLYGWKYDKDYVLLESEIGPAQHVSEEISGDYNPVDYQPKYWFLNGLSFPNTIHVGLPGANGWTDWIAAHPGYDPLITGSISKGHPGTRITNGDKVLIRMINMGYETQPMHMHGYHGKVIGSDQRAWYWANTPGITPFGLGMEKNTLTIGSGETYEWLVDFGQQALASTYPAETQTRYDSATNLPVPNMQTASPAIRWPADPTGDPYIAGPQVTGLVGLGGTTQIFPFHNHDDYKATNNGVYPGGMFTALVPTP
jgi:FtsP/CotA-like multicopper oxidase with cupredoxin domain